MIYEVEIYYLNTKKCTGRMCIKVHAKVKDELYAWHSNIFTDKRIPRASLKSVFSFFSENFETKRIIFG